MSVQNIFIVVDLMLQFIEQTHTLKISFLSLGLILTK